MRTFQPLHPFLIALLIGVTALQLVPIARGQSSNDGFVPDVNGLIRAMVVQADGRILIGGEFSAVNGITRSNLARLNLDGTVDLSFNPEANSAVYSVLERADGRIVVGGDFTALAGQARTNIAGLNANGSVDLNFPVQANNRVTALLPQPDGKILVGGAFTQLGGQARSRIARLNFNGTIDNFFNASADNEVLTLAIQANGKILVGGKFSMLGGQPHSRIGRLNADGTVDPSLSVGADNDVQGIVLQADGKIVLGGLFTLVGGGPNFYRHLVRLNSNGTIDPGYNPASDLGVLSLVRQPDGKILVGGNFSTLAGGSRSSIGRLNPDGSLDAGFNPGANGAVFSLAVQPDGRILAAGQFSMLGGEPHNNIGRLHAGGTLDKTFNPGSGGIVQSLTVQPDGKILVGGSFTDLAGQTRSNIARLNPDGSLDNLFNPGADNPVFSLALQPDGGIVVAGQFNILGGQMRRGLGRLHADGSVDGLPNLDAEICAFTVALEPDGGIIVGGCFTIFDWTGIVRLFANGNFDDTFNPNVGNGSVFTVAVEPDGQILLGGVFVSVGGEPRANIARVEQTGFIDTNFNPGVSGEVRAIAVQADGRIIVGGTFTALGPEPRSNIGRLNADGSVDPTFNPGADGEVFSIAIQADKKILVGGNFLNLANGARSRIGRLNPGGSLDNGFNPGANGSVLSVSLQPDGKVLAGGTFSSLGGQPRSRIGRVAGGIARQELKVNPEGTTVTWLRSGSGPEVEQVRFEHSTNGADYTLLGQPARSGGGWQLVDLALDPDQTFYLRARGRAVGGLSQGSSAVIESIGQFYLATTPPAVTTAAASSITPTSAFLNAVVDPNGAATTAFFQYGTDMSYGSSTVAKNVPLEGVPIGVRDGISNLSPGTTYHYRVVAQNSGGLSVGQDQSFRTALVVTNLADNGPGTLREAVINALPGDTIICTINGMIRLTTGAFTIGKDLNIVGPGADKLTVSGNNASRVFYIAGNATPVTVKISGLRIINGNGLGGLFQNQGGAIHNNRGTLFLTDCVLSNNNTSDRGGAVENNGVMIMSSCTISTNSSSIGGGIYLTANVMGTTNIIWDCAFVANSATFTGAGIYVRGGENTVINSTFSTNSAGARGAGIYVHTGTNTVVNDTFSDNLAPEGAAISHLNAGSEKIINSILANSKDGLTTNAVSDLFNSAATFNVTNSLIENPGGVVLNGSANIIAEDPLLQALANNGGPTLNMAPLFNSPVIDRGNNALALDANKNLLVTDQRRLPRFYDGDGNGYAAVDMGSYEEQNSPPFIEVIEDVRTPKNVMTNVDVFIGDLESQPGALTLSAVAAEPDVASTLAASGSGSSRTLTITPGLNTTGGTLITVTVKDDFEATASRTFFLRVFDPLGIAIMPSMPISIAPGGNVTFTATATGDGPYTYRWRYNGENIAGATNSTFTLTNVQPTDSGSYSVIVANPIRTLLSTVTTLAVTTPTLAFADNFNAATTYTTNRFVGSGDNVGATKEPTEPNHFGKVGGKSVWLDWQAPSNGVATFSTRGSSFDTLLAVYTGASLAGLTEVASDDDSNGFFTSRVMFRAQLGMTYHVAIDGRAEAEGKILLSWDLDSSETTFIPPRITTQPQSRTVLPGEDTTFSVTLTAGSDPITQIKYQWYNNFLTIPGATNVSYTVTNVQASAVGVYGVTIIAPGHSSAGATNESLLANLEIGNVARAPSEDKFDDLLASGTGGGGALEGGGSGGSFVSVAPGILNFQILANINCSSQPCESGVNGVISGSSRWLKLSAQTNGMMRVETFSSEVSVAVVAFSVNNLCQVNISSTLAEDTAAVGGINQIQFPVTAGSDYQVLIGGVGGAQGVIDVNWYLGTPPVASTSSGSRAFRSGQLVALNVSANGQPAPNFQWRRNGLALTSETNATLTVTNFDLAAAGTYSVITTNFAGRMTNSLGDIHLLELKALPKLSNNLPFRIFLNGKPGSNYVMEVNTNFSIAPTSGWLSIVTNRATNGTFIFTDVLRPSHLQPVYRARARP